MTMTKRIRETPRGGVTYCARRSTFVGLNEFFGALQRTSERSVPIAVRFHKTLELGDDKYYVITCGRSAFRNSRFVVFALFPLAFSLSSPLLVKHAVRARWPIESVAAARACGALSTRPRDRRVRGDPLHRPLCFSADERNSPASFPRPG